MKNVLITGINGFVGSHLAELLVSKKKYNVYGTVREKSPTEKSLENIEAIKDQLTLIGMELSDKQSVENTIKESKPDYLFHLAAQSFVPASWERPEETIIDNVVGTIKIFEMLRKNNLNPKTLIVGSSEEYGLVYPNEIPIKETNPLRPLNPYGVSRLAQDKLAFQYYKVHNLNIIISRVFNHTGPRRRPEFVTSNFAKQIVEIELGIKKPEIEVGNLESIRDFTDVRDIVKAYILAVEKCVPGEVYNICSGKGYKVSDVLKILLDISKNDDIVIKQDKNKMRVGDNPILIGDNTKFCKQTGWHPEIPFEQTLKDLLDYWRNKLK